MATDLAIQVPPQRNPEGTLTARARITRRALDLDVRLVKRDVHVFLHDLE